MRDNALMPEAKVTTAPDSPLADQLLSWFDQHGRHDLPWQQPRSAYRVWLSEIMLQQTQVGTVIPYFERFLQRFPNVQLLAAAPQDDVLTLWAGLGYYARARNLHKAAQQIVAEHSGEFPQSVAALEALPGIGRSTAGAIAAQAFGVRAAILDGNVKRVLARLFAVPGWPGETAVAAKLWQHAEALTPNQRLADYTQAIMDLGATLCTRSKPACLLCPWQPHCQASASGEPTQFPGKKPRKTKPQRAVQMLLLRNANNQILINRRPPTGIWGGLWSLPEIGADAAPAEAATELGFATIDSKPLPAVPHSFSHYQLNIQPVLLSVSEEFFAINDGGQQWLNLSTPASWPGLPAPVRKILEAVQASKAVD